MASQKLMDCYFEHPAGYSCEVLLTTTRNGCRLTMSKIERGGKKRIDVQGVVHIDSLAALDFEYRIGTSTFDLLVSRWSTSGRRTGEVADREELRDQACVPPWRPGSLYPRTSYRCKLRTHSIKIACYL